MMNYLRITSYFSKQTIDAGPPAETLNDANHPAHGSERRREILNEPPLVPVASRSLASNVEVRRTSTWTIWFFSKAKRAPKSISRSVQLKTKIPKSTSQRRADKSALALRAFTLGHSTVVAPKVTPATAKPQLARIKAQLSQPKQANKLISALHKLSPEGDHTGCNQGPIHAVCLSHTDAEEDALHFAKLPKAAPHSSDPSSTPIDQLHAVFSDIRVIDLVKSPDLGLGEPATSPGLLAGALPTPGVVLDGVKQITPELMALGYATGHLVQIDHSGVYPPTDRMSVLTYWWGLEILLPPPTIEYLNNVQSVTTTVMNFLSALALVNNGVREILPFVRYFSQFIDFEFNAIKKQDKGNGVVCAATWIMPAAMIPRPWDFPQPPEQPSTPGDSNLLDEKKEGNHVTVGPPL